MKCRRPLLIALALATVGTAALWLWFSRGEPVAALIAREGQPWLVAESAAIEYRDEGALLPSAYLVLTGVREWNSTLDPEVGTTLVYTTDESVRVYWRQRVERGGGKDEWFVLGSTPRFRCVRIDESGRAYTTISRRFFFVEVSSRFGAY
jgi:hypothetical protein